MKERNGFVSNSSSSSFILAIKKGEVCPECGRSDPSLLEAIEKYHDYNDDNEVKGVGAEHILYELNREEREGWPRSNANELKKTIAEYEDKEDWTIVEISISYHNEELNDLLSKLLKNGTAVKLDSDND